MLLVGKTQKKHPGDLPLTIPDLLPPPRSSLLKVMRRYKTLRKQFASMNISHYRFWVRIQGFKDW